MKQSNVLSLILAGVLFPYWTSTTVATPSLLTWSAFTNASDLSGLTGNLENGNPANIFGGVGSGLAWAGGNSFVMTPDRGPNAVAWNTNLDNTTSYISRLQNVTMELKQSSPGVFNLTPILTGTTLLYSTNPLSYGATSTVVGGNYYFNGRSDNFGTGNSLNSNNARSDPEGVRVSSDGRYVYVSDEYGPYVYQFDRETGVRTKAFALPDNLGVTNLSSRGAVEIANNVSGRVANKGMEGLAISPDGGTLFGFMQGPLLQDTNGGGYYNRIVKIDVATGETHEYAYDNRVGGTNNSSELLAINDHEFLVLERDSKGLGDGTSAVIKDLIKINLTGATDVTALSGSASLAPYAVSGTVFLDIVAALNNAGISSSNIPSKLEGIAWGQDVMINGTNTHTLYMANDNDFVANTSGPSKVFVFGVTDADLGGSSLTNQSISLQLGGDLYVGSNSTVAPVNYTSGTNFYNNIYVGYGAAASNNELLVANAGTLLTNSGEFYVGYSGSGNSLTVSNGGRVVVSGSANWLAIGENDGANSNTVTVTGSNSQLNVEGWLEVGWGTNSGNQMTIAAGALVSDSNGYIGYTNGSSSNSVTISSGGTWSNRSSFYVGYSGGSNNLIISGAGTVTDLTGTIGYHGDGNMATVTGSNSLWSNASSLSVGICGNTAQLTISYGGGVISSNGLISAISGWSNCSVTVVGTGSYWSNSGNLTIGSQANGLNAPSSGNSLLISSGGVASDSNAVIANATNFFNNSVTVTGSNSFWSNSGSIDLGVLGSGNNLVISNGGSVVATGIIETNGTTDGPLALATTLGDSNVSSNNSILITGTGSSMTNAGRLRIGYYGSSNSVTVADGGQLIGTRSANITLGFDVGSSNNLLIISGSNSLSSNNGGTYVGYGGSGNSISLSGGATMISGSTNPAYYGSNINYNDSYVGFYAASSNNSINLTGSNTAWMNTGSLNIGYDGSGNTMVLSNGASLIMIQASGTNAWISLGENSNSFGNSLTVATNSIASAQYVDVGWSGGSNVMTVKDGGIVTDTYGVIGHDSKSYGNSVLVTGGNSHWNSATSLIVGSYGNSNSLVISNGGKVSDYQGGLGVDAAMAPTSSSGNGVLITGSNSIWTNADIFVIGSGTVTVANGGILAASSIQIGQFGDLDFGRYQQSDSAGSVKAASILFVGTNGDDYGINFNQTNSLEVTNSISGTGWVCQLGTGTTTLSASNSYTLYTAVDAGELHIASTGSLNGGGTTTIAAGGSLRNEGYISGQAVINGILCGNNGSFRNLTLEPGASSTWHLSSFTGTAGVSWDLLSTTNLDLSDLSSTNPFTINIVGTSGEGNGSSSYVFSYINVTGVLSGFNSADFVINTSNFTMSPNLEGGSWNVTSTIFDGVTTLSVIYAVPEPSFYVLFVLGVIGIGMRFLHRKV